MGEKTNSRRIFNPLQVWRGVGPRRPGSCACVGSPRRPLSAGLVSAGRPSPAGGERRGSAAGLVDVRRTRAVQHAHRERGAREVIAPTPPGAVDRQIAIGGDGPTNPAAFATSPWEPRSPRAGVSKEHFPRGRSQPRMPSDNVGRSRRTNPRLKARECA
ncbi:hypothetical protein AAFF_G00053570 [Aldrovandia affinis]|uniref:Uncharacterized protein n=1 Tax=Aldrovandia affinis TaxID=143900 RepID=A0AAD7S157_9TELE|nr:hypothetical protein AAFF_G00053570 [Aldrovandia affinis]